MAAQQGPPAASRLSPAANVDVTSFIQELQHLRHVTLLHGGVDIHAQGLRRGGHDPQFEAKLWVEGRKKGGRKKSGIAKIPLGTSNLKSTPAPPEDPIFDFTGSGEQRPGTPSTTHVPFAWGQ